ncbi:MAG: hypothetical protein ACFFD4_25965 [Candidatus Odinarchaeota archaeon]
MRLITEYRKLVQKIPVKSISDTLPFDQAPVVGLHYQVVDMNALGRIGKQASLKPHVQPYTLLLKNYHLLDSIGETFGQAMDMKLGKFKKGKGHLYGLTMTLYDLFSNIEMDDTLSNLNYDSSD